MKRDRKDIEALLLEGNYGEAAESIFADNINALKQWQADYAGSDEAQTAAEDWAWSVFYDIPTED